MILRVSTICFFIIQFLSACREKPAKMLFTLAEKSNIEFINTLAETKEYNVFRYRNFYNGGGVATGDLNNDGLPEVFFTANQGSNKLYLNKGNMSFEDITNKAGFSYRGEWSTGVVFVDINADGWLDIYVCNAGNMLNKELRKNQLYINNKNLTFTESASTYGLDNQGYSTQASFFDYDLDGDLDCFLINNSPIPVNTLNFANMRNIPDSAAPYADFLKGGGDHLFRNDNGKFTDVTQHAGIYGSIISFGLGLTVGDINEDGYPDVYVSNDFFEKDYLYINQRNGTFKEEIEQRTQHISFSSMGADMQDINNDGRQDIFTTDMLPGDDYRLKTNTSFEGYEIFRLKQNQGFFNQFTQNCLQVNNGDGKFLETAFYGNVSASDWSWGALMFDADNDGHSDIFVTNGIFRDVTDQDFIDFFANEIVSQMALSGKKEEVEKVIDKMPSVPIPNKMFRNRGSLRFTDESLNWGFEKASFSNGASYADLDNDGDLDLVINNVNQKAMVYRNNSSEFNKAPFISVSLKFKSPNPFGIGSTVRIFCGDQIITRELIPSRGFQSSIDYKMVIGLGTLKPDSLQVLWPDRSMTSIVNPAINRIHQINYQQDSVRPFFRKDQLQNTLFKEARLPLDTNKEDDHVDFYIERNIPFMLSKQGPKAAVADVNGDGTPDLYIGGSVKQERQLYLQTSKGLIKKPVDDFKRVNFNDITAAFFFDADQDGDQDLFTGGGGNFQPSSSEIYQNHIFINDGKGNFNLRAGAIPLSHTNCGVAIPIDYDKDGKQDIFIGSRSEPQQYGIAPKSFLMHNKGDGVFEDETKQIAPFLENLGMITGAEWYDLNGDGKEELIIIGEWMYPHVYQYSGKGFVEIKSGLENLFGWWQSIAFADLDKDGDADLVLGNLGDNFYLRAEKDKPVKLWIKDFDNNGTMEKIFSHTVNKRDVPVFLKKEITEQIPSLKKLNLKHKDFANKSIQELFTNEMEGVHTLQVNYNLSCIAINNGQGQFTIKPLPLELQLSSVNAIAISDVNQDSNPDIIAGGNFFDLLPQFCRVDASYTNVLLNDGKANFKVASSAERGISLNGQIRDIKRFEYGKKDGFLFLLNNEQPVYFTVKPSPKGK